jgi:protease IV
MKVNMTGDVKMTGDVATRLPPDNTAHPVRQRVVNGDKCTCTKIAIIDVDGMLLNRNFKGSESMGENPVSLFHEKLQAAAVDPQILAVIVRINSPGGSVTATDLMRRDLQQFKVMTGKQVYASILDVGAGGAYYLATVCDSISAHPTSVVGGVGVILNLYDMRETLAQQNIFPMTIRSGEFIDLGSPIHRIADKPAEDEEAVDDEGAEDTAADGKDADDKESAAKSLAKKEAAKKEAEKKAKEAEKNLTPAERNALESRRILESIAKELHDRFRNSVIDARPTVDVNHLDGRVLSATQAQASGMVDNVMYLDDLIAHAKNASGAGDSAKVVMFRRCNDRALTEFDITPNTPVSLASLPLSIPGLDRANLPHFLYLWQPETGLEAHGY